MIRMQMIFVFLFRSTDDATNSRDNKNINHFLFNNGFNRVKICFYHCLNIFLLISALVKTEKSKKKKQEQTL